MSTSHHPEVFLQARRIVGPYCARVHHANNKRCIFRIEPAAVSPHFVVRQLTFYTFERGKSYEHHGRRFVGSVT
jgi:hypothetical protein